MFEENICTMFDENVVDECQTNELGENGDFVANDGGPNNASSEQNTENHLEPLNSDTNNTQHVGKKQTLSKFERKKRNKRIGSTIISTIVWIVGFCLLYLCLSNIYQNVFNPSGYTGFFGIGQAVVASNSMEPDLFPNDLIFYRQADETNVSVGDTIIYQKTDSNGEKTLVVHNVLTIQDGYVTTKGINNAMPDEAFPSSCIVGKYMFKISQAGILLNLLSTNWAPVIILLFLCAVLAIQIVVYYVRRKQVIASISVNDKTRMALKHFFDI